MLVELVPEVRFDTAAAAVQQLPHAEAGHAAHEGRRKQQTHGDLHLAEGLAAPKRIDSVLDEPGTDGGKEVGDDDQGEAEGVRAEVGPQEGQQGPQFVHRRGCNVTGPRDPGKSHLKEDLMTRSFITVLALAGVAACGGGERQDIATADSLSRDLQLAPMDSSAPLNDQPSMDTAPTPAATPAPAPAAPKPKPKPKPTPKPAAPAPAPAAPAPAPAAPAPAPSLAAGTAINATTDAEIRSRKNKVGDEVTATVASDVKDANGKTVIPAGSKVVLKVTAIKPSDSKSDTTGTLTLDAVGVEVGGTERPIVATISGIKTSLKGSGTDANDIAKVAGGTAAGAIVGKVLGGGSKGAIIGGIIGGAVGTQRAIETKDRDIVLPAGTTVTLTLDQKLAVS